MPNNNITIDVSQLNRLGQGLSRFESEIPGAVVSVINRTVDYIYTRIGKLVTDEYAIKATDVKKTIKKTKAGKGHLSANLKSSSRTLSFSHFKFTPSTPLEFTMLSIRYGTRVKVKIKKKGRGLKQVNTTNKPFIAKIGGVTNVYVHRSSDNKMVSLRTLSVPQMIQNVDVAVKIQKDIDKKLSERIDHEIDYRLMRLRRP